MGKQIIHINLSSPDAYHCLTQLGWCYEQSDRLVIDQIDLNDRERGPFEKVPGNLLSWFTDQGAWGREIRANDISQKEPMNWLSISLLYAPFAFLKTTII